jgi:hypothetical protein
MDVKGKVVGWGLGGGGGVSLHALSIVPHIWRLEHPEQQLSTIGNNCRTNVYQTTHLPDK